MFVVLGDEELNEKSIVGVAALVAKLVLQIFMLLRIVTDFNPLGNVTKYLDWNLIRYRKHMDGMSKYMMDIT